VDENEWSLNDAALAIEAVTDDSNSHSFIDYPGSYHAGSCGFSFADGHGELHKWRGQQIQLNGPAAVSTVNADPPDQADYMFLAMHASIKIRE